MTRRGEPARLLLVPILLLAAWLRHVTPAEVADLLPRPDAIEYEESARNLAAGRGFVLELDGSTWTPRYPPGFPLLIAAAIPATGDEPGCGTWVVQLSALLAVAAAWFLATRVAGPWAGAAAALVVALSRLHVGWSRLVMSDVPSSAACGLVAAWFLASLDRRPRAFADAAIGIATGALAALRPTNLALVPAMLATLAIPADAAPGASGQRSRRALSLLVGLALGLAPIAAWQARRFGSPFATGYAPHLARVRAFAADYAWSIPGERGTEPNLPYYAKTLAGLGWGVLWAWPIGLLLVLGAWRSLRSREPRARRLAVLALVFTAAVLAVHAPFFWQWDRFLLPLVPVLAALAAVGVVDPDDRRASIAGGALLAAGLALSIAREGPIRTSPLTRTIAGEAAELRLVDATVEPDAILVLHADPLLAQRILGPGAPGNAASGDPRRRERRLVGIGSSEYEPHLARPQDDSATEGWLERPFRAPFDRRAFSERIGRLLAEGRPVYLGESARDREVRFADELHAAAREDFDATPVARRGDFVLSRLRPVPAVGGEPAAAP